MIRFKIASSLSVAVLLAVAGSAGAATKTETFTVSAAVDGNCVIFTNDLAFGPFDGATDLTQTATISVRCTSGTPYEVELSPGASGDYNTRTMSDGGTPANTLAYNLYTDAGHTLVWGDGTTSGTDSESGVGTGLSAAQTQNHTVYGELVAAGNEDAPVGNYSDTITATVVY